MLALNDRSLVVPSDKQDRSFRYTHAETGHVSHGADYRSWIIACKEHRRANNLPIPADFASRAEDQLCGELPPTWCKQSGGSTVDTGFSLGDVVDWIKAVANRFVSGQPLVSQEEANRRARICVQCPLNIDAGGCGSCSKAVSFLTPGMASRSTPYDSDLKNCAICKCFNRVQAFFPLSALLANETPEKEALYPAFCWKQPVGHNFIPDEAVA